MSRLEGTQNYANSKVFYRKRNQPRRFVRNNVRFDKRVRKAVENTMLEKANYLVQQWVRIVAAVGAQNYGTILIRNSNTDLNNIFTKITTPVSGGQPSSTLKSMRFTITGYVAQIIMKCQSNLASCKVDIYEMVPRNDTTDSPASSFAQSFVDQGNSGQDTVVGSSPFMANGFCSLFKILKKRTVFLVPGAAQMIEVRDKVNRKIEYERLFMNTSTQLFRGLTKIWFAVVHGEPTNDATTKTNISTANVAVDFLTTETYYYTFMPQNVVQSTVGTTFPAITLQNTVDVVTGVVGASVNQ